jgi:hypothetical protein
MPVSVHVPIRIRTEPRIIAEQPDLLTEALARAVGRALAASRQHVLEPRGAYVGLRFSAPAFRWVGDGLAAVPPERRAALEGRIADLIERTAERTGVFELARENAEAGLPLEDPPVERVNPRRVLPGGYVIPSYGDQRFDFEAVEILGEPDPEKRRLRMLAPHQWRSFSDLDAVRRAMIDAAWDHGLNGEGGDQTWLGALCIDQSGRPTLVVYTTTDDPDGRYTFVELYTLNRLTQPVWSQDRKQVIEQPAKLPAGGVYVVEGFRPASDAAARKAILVEILGADLQAEFLKVPVPDQFTSEQYSTWMNERIDARFAEDADADGGAAGYLILRAPTGQRFCITLAPAEGADMPWPLAGPMPVVALGRESSKGPGEKAGKGRGATLKKGQKGTGETREGGGEPGGFVITAGELEGFTDDPRASKFPPIHLGGGEPIKLGPLEGEASLEELGADGAAIKKIMEQLAYRLEMPMGEYPGAFAVAAATMLTTRALQVGRYSVLQPSATRNVPGGTGNLGAIQFDPLPSPGIQLLRHLAGTCRFITELRDAISDVYKKPEQSAKIRGTYRGEWAGWSLRLLEALAPRMKEGVGLGIFMRGCQTLLLQLLRSSHDAIQQRVGNDQYAALFEQIVLGQLTAVETLQAMKENLDAFLRRVDPSVKGVVGGAISTWKDARRFMGLAAPGGMPTVSGPSAATFKGLVHYVDGRWVVQDAQGRDWTQEDLETAIAIKRGTAEAIDPLIKQITDLPEVMPKFRADRALIRPYLDQLLAQMLHNNEEQTRKTTESVEYAFRASRISENLPQATIPYTTYELGGIHRVFHDTIGDAFHGDTYYGMGIDALFSAELGREALSNFFEFTGTLLLSIVCAPLGSLVSIGFALHRRERALERLELYHSLIDPELIASYAELELELFMAEVETAMNIIPMAGKAAKVGIQGARATLKQGLRAGLRATGRQAVKQLLGQITKELKQGLVSSFVREVVQQKVMEVVLNHVLEPVIADLYKELAVGGPAGVTSNEGNPLATASGPASGIGAESQVITQEELQQLPIDTEDGS